MAGNVQLNARCFGDSLTHWIVPSFSCFYVFFFFLFCTAHLSIHLHPSIPSQRDNWFGLRFRFGFGVSYRFGFRFRCRFEFGFGCGYRYRFRGMLNMSHVCHTCLAFVVEPNAQLQTYVNRKKPGSMYVHTYVCMYLGCLRSAVR